MQKAILIILDGYGEGKADKFNAVKNAKSPTLDSLKSQPYSLLKTDSEAVGLFKGDLGGSEVGHMTIGSGRITPTTAKQISIDIDSKEFEKKKIIIEQQKRLSKNGGDIHIVGLCSDKNIHSNINHAYEIINLFKDYAKNVYFHFITDGRDSGAYESEKYYKNLKNYIKNIKNCQVLSISGRFFGMDRESHNERVEQAINSMFYNNNEIKENEIENYLKKQYKQNVNDQYITPVHIKSESFKSVSKNDCIFFFNFREDRLRQIVSSCEKFGCDIITMSDVGGSKTKVLYPKKAVKNTLCEYLSNMGARVVKISESTKYAHVTYFFNGGREQPFKNEDRIHIPSLPVDDFSKTPKMKAKEITKEILLAMKKEYDCIVANYSNCDMVGHTGNYEAAKKAVEYVDKCIKRVLHQANKSNYKVLLTADHGNCEQMRTSSGEPHMAHTLNKVACVAVGYNMKKYGELKDVAPTLLELMELKNCKSFEGESLILK